MKRILIVLTSLSLIAGFVAAAPARVSAAPSAPPESTFVDGYDVDIEYVVALDGTLEDEEFAIGSCDSPNFHSIQDAIDAAEGRFVDPYAIKVCDGVYEVEGLDATLGLTLVGESRSGTILDGTGNDYPILTADYVEIWDITFRNGNVNVVGGDNGGAIRAVNGLSSDVICYNSVFSNNTASGDGGAIWAVDNVVMEDCLFEGNLASDEGGAIYATELEGTGLTFSSNSSTRGGAVYVAELTDIDRSTFEDGSANQGAAIYVAEGDLDTEISRSMFRSNDASDDGGALYYNEYYKLMMDSVAFIDNEGYDGGAIYLTGGHPSEDYLDINGTMHTPSIFEGNEADDDAGAIYVNDSSGDNTDGIVAMDIEWARFINNTAQSDDGGAILSNNEIRIAHTLFDGNYADEYGGAIHTHEDMEVTYSTFTNNEADEDDGGAISVDGHLYVADSYFSGNFSDDSDAGAIDAYELAILRSTFVDNWAEEDGGAVKTDELEYVRQSTFTGNYSEFEDGGAIYVADGYDPSEVDRTVFRNNTAYDNGGALYYSWEYHLTIIGSSFISNTAYVNESVGGGGAIYLGGYPYDDPNVDYLSILGAPNAPTLFQGNHSDNDGGAIKVNTSLDDTGMTVTGARFNDNSASDDGGAIYSANEINLVNATFSGNRADSSGGAVYAWEPTTVRGSTFSKNVAIDFGGAVYSEWDLGVVNSTFTNNSADSGGAIFTDHSTGLDTDLWVEGSRFTGNRAEGEYGESLFDDGRGGAIISYSERTTISRSTFTKNSATDQGGAIQAGENRDLADYSSGLQIMNSTFSGNVAEEAGAVFARFNYTTEMRGNLFQSNQGFGVDDTPDFTWSVGAVMTSLDDGGTFQIFGNRFISNLGRGVGALYLVQECDPAPVFDRSAVRANTWRSNRVTGGQPQTYRDVRTESWCEVE